MSRQPDISIFRCSKYHDCFTCPFPVSVCPAYSTDNYYGKVRPVVEDVKDARYVSLDLDRVVEGRKQGLTQAETAQRLAVERHTLSRRFRWRWGKDNLPPVGEIQYLREVCHWTQAQVCRHFRIDHKTLKKYGLWEYEQFRGKRREREK